MPHRIDNVNSSIGKVIVTSQGYLRLPIVIGKGNVILSYKRADGSIVKEFRPVEEVSKGSSLDTAKAAPISVGHKAHLDSTNTIKFEKGHLGDNVKYNLEKHTVNAEAIVKDKRTIEKVKRKDLVDVSPGYDVRIEEISGEINGERYDRIQRDIVYNHIALLPKGQGRQGSEVSLRLDDKDNIIEEKLIEREVKMKVKIRFDGKDYEIEVSNETSAQILKDMQERYDSNLKDKDRIEGELSASKKSEKEATERADKAEDLETINIVVQERLDAIDKLKKFNPKLDLKEIEKKSVKDIRLDAIEAAGNKREDFSNKTDDFVTGFFNGLSIPTQSTSKRMSVGGPIPRNREDKKEENKNDPKQARIDMNDSIQNAWKKKGE